MLNTRGEDSRSGRWGMCVHVTFRRLRHRVLTLSLSLIGPQTCPAAIDGLESVSVSEEYLFRG